MNSQNNLEKEEQNLKTHISHFQNLLQSCCNQDSVVLACVHGCSVASVVSNSLWPYRVRLLCPWDTLGKNTGVCCHALLQGIFPTQHQTHVSCISCTAGIFFTHWSTWKAHSIGIRTGKEINGIELRVQKYTNLDLPGDPLVKNLAGDTNSIPDLGRFHMPWDN